MIRRFVLVLLLGLWCAPTPLVHAESSEESARPVLQGLKGVYVLVENLEEELTAAGIQRLQLQSYAEVRLMEAGIRVLEHEQVFQRPGIPFLYINVGSFKFDQESFAVCIDVSLREQVRLLRREESPAVVATTWRKGARVGVLPAKLVARGIRQTIDDAIQEFIQDLKASRNIQDS